MDWRRWASIARLSIRKMCCLNGSRCRDQALDPFIFRTKCDFLQVLDLLIFLQKQPGHWHCLYAAKAVPMNGAPSSNADKAAFRRLPFSPSFISHICLPNGKELRNKKQTARTDTIGSILAVLIIQRCKALNVSFPPMRSRWSCGRD